MTANHYRQQIDRIPVLSKRVELELAKRIQAGDTRAADKLIRHNLRFVIAVARQYDGQGMPLDDLIQQGNLGIITAAKRFDANKGFRFISYAVWWIRQSIMLALSAQSRIVHVPYNSVFVVTRAVRERSRLEQKHRRKVTPQEVAASMGISTDTATRALQYTGHVHASIHAKVADTDAICLEDTMSTTTDSIEDDLDARQLAAVILDVARTTLPYLQYKTLDLYYGLQSRSPMTYAQAGRMLGLSRQRATSLANAALVTLRPVLQSMGIDVASALQ